MRETVRSLRVYFGIVAAFRLFSAFGQLARPDFVSVPTGLLVLVLAIYFGFISARLPLLLARTPVVVYVALGLDALASVMVGVVAVAAGAPGPRSVLVPVIGLFIVGYLYVNVKRLGAELRASPVTV